MKLTHYFLAVALAVATVGCNQNKDSSIPNQEVSTNQDATNQLSQTKDQFVAGADKELKELDNKIADLSQKAANLKDDAKVQADKALTVLRADRDIVAQKYADMKQSNQGTWDKTKSAFQAAWGDMERAYDDAKAKFNSSSNTSTNSP